ncbi:MAG TPA: endonuclease III, partial [candidate division Zixibacteria bacterium]|nr:endonuclease III [candidate division Zixibacteria bacterium]
MNESLADKRARARKIIARLKKAYPDSECSLKHKNPYQLMVATILSAQCTDERVNMVTPALFERFPAPEKMAGAAQDELEELIKTTGFFRNKAKSIKNNAIELLQRHAGAVPRTLAELVKLPGVGRKTASAVLGAGFGLAEGVVVDTHVTRISRLLGLTSQKTPEKIERDLMEILPKKDWIGWTHMIIDHGRAVCIARRPRCGDCALAAP